MQADPTPGTTIQVPDPLSLNAFRRRFRWLILLTWIIPAIFGMGFLLFIRMFTFEQLLLVQTRPLEPLFVLAIILGGYLYFTRYVRPVEDWIVDPSGTDASRVLDCVRGFPLRYWLAFVGYLVLAPSVVIVAAQWYSNFVATPVDWFRIHLVALIVSIIVGLPIFFLIFDLFGRALGGIRFERPILTIKTKVFLIGALVPLLIDTMLVQYYWTRTGFFTRETFGIWLLLELLAIAGSLIFVRSFGQSLASLQALIGAPRPLPAEYVATLRARSTDELGLLTQDYRLMLEDLRLQSEILELSNRLLRSAGSEAGTAAVFDSIVNLCRESIGADQAFLIVFEPEAGTLLGVAQTGGEYRPEGYFRLTLADQSLAVSAFNSRATQVADDARNDPRVSPQLSERYGVRSTLATPMRVGDEWLGVLMVAHTRDIHPYSARDRTMIEALAREAAIAVQTQRLQKARTEAEIAMRGSEQRYRLLFENMTSGFALHEIICDAKGNPVDYLYLEVNPAFEKLTGVPASTLVGKTLRSVMPDTEKYWIEVFGRVALTGKPIAYENYSRELGRYYDTWVFSPEKNQFAVIFSDSTERKLAETTLRESEQRLKQQQDALIRLADQQVYAASDISRVLQAVTETVSNVLGVQRVSLWSLDQERNVLTCQDLFNRESSSHGLADSLSGELYPTYFVALRANRQIVAENAHQAPETKEFSQSYLSTLGIGAMLDAPIHRAGRAIGVLCCEHVGGPRHWTTDEVNFVSSVADFVSLCLELHEHHRTAGELAEHREHLEELVSARTIALEVANRELEAFSYSVSHDLRAPLRAIDGFARALIEDYAKQLDDTGRAYLDRVSRGAQRMGSLIDDLLQLSRVSRIEFHPVSVDLSSMVREVTKRLAEDHPGHRVDTLIAPDVVATGDPRLLHIALTNLLENAWKYTSKTDPARIEFGTQFRNGEVVYYVRDNGVGFDMQYAGRLFGAFQRLHGTEFPGTGIGLATVQRIVHRHGGRVWAEAETGKGAIFYFTLGVDERQNRFEHAMP